MVSAMSAAASSSCSKTTRKSTKRGSVPASRCARSRSGIQTKRIAWWTSIVHSLTTDVTAVIRRADVDLVCELIGGTIEAKRAVLAAIAAGKHVVTANKALLAEHGAEVFGAAEAANVDIYYEAAVCGGVPIIRVLREGLASDRIEALWGIVNGTSNFILSTMTETRRPFADILAEAQQLGYAEADPTSTSAAATRRTSSRSSSGCASARRSTSMRSRKTASTSSSRSTSNTPRSLATCSSRS